MKKIAQRLSALVALTALIGLSQSAHADYTFVFGSQPFGGSATIKVNDGTGFVTNTVGAGAYTGTIKENVTGSKTLNVAIYCVDVFHWVGTGNQTPTDIPTLLDPFDGLQFQDYNKGTTTTDKLARAKAVRYVIDNYLPNSGTTSSINWGSLTKKSTQIAQLAIWDIMVDGNGGSNSTTSGNFQVTDYKGTGATGTDVSNLVTLAYSNLNTVMSGTNEYLIQTPPQGGVDKQDFAFRSSAPIPEPAFYQIAAFVGLGGMGLMRLRRRKA